MTENTQDESTQLETQASTAQIDIGATLRSAREKKQVSVVDLADKLKLSSKLIEALEAEDLEALPAATFVRGYLRSIGAELELNGDELVQAYTAIVPAQKNALSSTYTATQQHSSKDPLMVWASFAIAGILVVLVAVWSLGFLSDADDPTAADTADSQPTPESAATAEELLPDISIQLDQQFGEPASAGSARSEAAVSSGDNADGGASNEPAQTNESDETNEGAMSGSEGSSALPISTDQGATIHSKASVGSDILVLTLSGDSWAEVTDANDFAHIFGTIGVSDSPIKLVGESPFELFLGDARQVAITYNKHSFDHSSYIRSNHVAQFQVQ